MPAQGTTGPDDGVGTGADGGVGGLPAPCRRGLVGLWWLSPPGAVALVVPLTLGLAVAYTPEDYRTYFDSPAALTPGGATLFAAGALAFVLGALVVQAGRRPAPRAGTWPWFDERQLAALRRAATVLFRVTAVGYASFVVSAARGGVRPSDVLSAVTSQDVSGGELENAIGTVPGVTTLTQVGIAYAVVAAVLLRHGPEPREVRRLAVLGGLTLVRAFVLTERLALIEVAVPALAVLVLPLSARLRGGRRLLLRLAPVPLVALLLLGFAASEYSRSYTFYSSRTSDGLLVFSAKRLSGYYATAYTNGELLLEHEPYPGRLPYRSTEALWTAPVVEQLRLYDRLSGRDGQARYDSVLETYGNPEFNNPGGLAVPFVDFGTGGGLLVMLGLGAVMGTGYRAATQGSVPAVLLYPVAVTGLYELPRFLYWTLGRTVPAVLALLLVAAAVHRSTRARPHVDP